MDAALPCEVEPPQLSQRHFYCLVLGQFEKSKVSCGGWMGANYRYGGLNEFKSGLVYYRTCRRE
jgi:hypothetical protein